MEVQQGFGINGMRQRDPFAARQFLAAHVRFTPESDRLLRRRKMTLCAMYGRRPRCKGKVGHFSEAFGCSHVFGLWMQPLWLLALM